MLSHDESRTGRATHSNDDADVQVFANDKLGQLCIPCFGHVVSHYYCIVGQLFQEALLGVGLEVEVQLRRAARQSFSSSWARRAGETSYSQTALT